ncbi:carbamate kinase [Candidatus Woesearchaeota archaeon]|nr:carbamate kinase [Candidatus Woesearchaeota archaeon]
MKIIIALGGNALIKKGEKETYSNLLKNIKKTCSSIIPFIKNNKVVITHGSGPQIGNLLLQNEIARKKVPEMPLDVLNAESEGLIGYLLQEQLSNEIHKRKMHKNVVTLLTEVLVSKNDPAFKNPTKFIGPFYTKKQAIKLKNKFIIKKDSNRGYRRVVASPKPIKIIEGSLIKELVNSGHIVIAAGGGGIPVASKNKRLTGVKCVIDKDLASSCLAKEIKADLLLILTDVDKVYLNYGKKNQKGLSRLNLRDAKKYLKEGHFAAGSMKPKIEASIDFVEHGGKKVIISGINSVEKALKGNNRTIIKKT